MAPVEVRGDDDRAHGGVGGILLIAHRGVVEVGGVQGLRRRDVPGDRLGVRVQQQLGGVAAQATVRVVGAVDAVSVDLTGLDRGQIGVPYIRVHLRQLDPGLGAGLVEEAQLNPLGDGGEHREVRARAVVGRAQRIGLPRPGCQRLRGGGVRGVGSGIGGSRNCGLRGGGGRGGSGRSGLGVSAGDAGAGGAAGVLSAGCGVGGVGGRGPWVVGCCGRHVSRDRDTLPRAHPPAPQHEAC